MAKATTKLDAQDQVILFCAATGIDHAALGILAHAMRSMAIRGFTDSGRATLVELLERAKIIPEIKA
jgi:hypothetical protein